MKRSISLFRKVLIGYLISILVFIALVAAAIMCFINLKTYAVYYAERTPHSDNVDPVAIEIIENLGWNEFPAGGIYNGDFDGKNCFASIIVEPARALKIEPLPSLCSSQ